MVWSDEHRRGTTCSRLEVPNLYLVSFILSYIIMASGSLTGDPSAQHQILANQDNKSDLKPNPTRVLALISLIFVEWRVNIRTTRTKRRPSVCFEQNVVDNHRSTIKNNDRISCNHLIAAKIVLIKNCELFVFSFSASMFQK